VDWENERWIKVYTREQGSDMILSWDARALWLEIMKRLCRAGQLDMGGGGVKALAIMVRHDADAVAKALTELVKDGRVVINGDVLFVPNFHEAQDSRTANAERQRRRREKVVADAKLAALSHPVTASHTETQRDTTRRDETIRDDTRKKGGAASAISLSAVSTLNELTGRSFKPEAKPTMDDARRLAKLGHTPEQAADVVRAKVREWQADAKMSKQLKPSVLLRPSNFRRYLAEDVEAGSAVRELIPTTCLDDMMAEVDGAK